MRRASTSILSMIMSLSQKKKQNSVLRWLRTHLIFWKMNWIFHCNSNWYDNDKRVFRDIPGFSLVSRFNKMKATTCILELMLFYICESVYENTLFCKCVRWETINWYTVFAASLTGNLTSLKSEIINRKFDSRIALKRKLIALKIVSKSIFQFYFEIWIVSHRH